MSGIWPLQREKEKAFGGGVIDEEELEDGSGSHRTHLSSQLLGRALQLASKHRPASGAVLDHAKKMLNFFPLEHCGSARK